MVDFSKLKYHDDLNPTGAMVACMGTIKDRDGIVDCDDFRFIVFPNRSGDGYRCITLGSNALRVSGFTDSHAQFVWISVASIVAIWSGEDWPSVREALTRLSDDRQFFAIPCSRDLASRVLRQYIQRRDGYVRRECQPVQSKMPFAESANVIQPEMFQ